MKREIDYEKVLEKCGLSMKRCRRNAGLAKSEVARQKKEFDELEKKNKKKSKLNRIIEAEVSEIKSEYV